jgi:anti-sigma regulatory factor (Ser/Thr protein kinase)
MKRSWNIPKDTAQLSELREAIKDFMKDITLEDTRKARMVLCVDEAAANIMEHVTVSSAEVEIKEFDVEVNIDETHIKVTFIHKGKRYDPTQSEKVNLKEHIKAGNKGGLGIFIMKSHLDIFEYNYSDPENFLTLGMKLNP